MGKNRLPCLHVAAALLLVAASAAQAQAQAQVQAQAYTLEGAVVDSRNGQSLGVINERGDIAGVFRAQKAMTFGILRAAGISLEQLPADVRARIERFQTQNVEAFRAFSEGLDLKDKGRFAEAKAQFRRAAELDPGFALAQEQAQAMPDSNVTAGLQMRALLAAVAGTAVDRGKVSVVVDAARAIAALGAGLQVVAIAAEPSSRADNTYTANPAGAGNQFQPDLVVGLAYHQVGEAQAVLGVASAQVWPGTAYAVDGNALESIGGPGAFEARRARATQAPVGSTALADGSSVYWGSWAASPQGNWVAASRSNAIAVAGPFAYVIGQAPTEMPQSNTFTFAARANAGTLGSPEGNIVVDFARQTVALQNLGFTIDERFAFSGLNGNARFGVAGSPGNLVAADPNAADRTPRYTSGSCAGCGPGFTASSGTFGGNFVGRGYTGLVFSTILPTGVAATPVVSGVHLFARP